MADVYRGTVDWEEEQRCLAQAAERVEQEEVEKNPKAHQAVGRRKNPGPDPCLEPETPSQMPNFMTKS